MGWQPGYCDHQLRAARRPSAGGAWWSPAAPAAGWISSAYPIS